jgi:hypothetical protein
LEHAGLRTIYYFYDADVLCVVVKLIHRDLKEIRYGNRDLSFANTVKNRVGSLKIGGFLE